MSTSTLQFLEQIFQICIIPLLGIATAYVVAFIKAKKEELMIKTQKIKDEKDQALVQKYIERTEKIVSDCVEATNQTFVNSLKQQGSFTSEAMKEAFSQTYSAAVSMLADDAQECLTEVFGDLTLYLTTMIEKSVLEKKQ